MTRARRGTTKCGRKVGCADRPRSLINVRRHHTIYSLYSVIRFIHIGDHHTNRWRGAITISASTWDTYGMNTESQQLLRTALALPESDRAEIAATLIHSLDTETDEDVDAAWAVEIQRRIELIDNGEVKLVPWEDVMCEMRDRRHG